MKLTHIQNTGRDDWQVVCDLATYEIEELVQKGATKGAYWYRQGSYEGSGYVVFFAADRWHLHDMSHCSCYSPMELLKLGAGFQTLDDLLTKCSDELRSEILPLVEFLKSNP